jgi:hypothetical protein
VHLCRRNEAFLLQTISTALENHPTSEVNDKLQALVDYLDIPDPVLQLLPPFRIISLQHLPVLDLHYYALAKQPMTLTQLNSFHNHQQQHMEVQCSLLIFVSTKEVDRQLSGVSVHAVGGGNLQEPSWACTKICKAQQRAKWMLAVTCQLSC